MYWILLTVKFFSDQRTNNVLKSYNREFANIFPHPRPNLFTFAECLEEEARGWAERVEDARSRTFVNRQKRAEIVWPEIPRGFVEFAAKKGKK